MSPSRYPRLRLTTMIGLGLVLALGLVCVVKTTPDTTIKHVSCSVASYNGSEAYAFSVAIVKLYLLDFTSSAPGYDYRNASPWTAAPCYGHSTCNQALTKPDCDDCMFAARTIIDAGCPRKVGAQLELADCFMRYENYEF